MEGHSPNLESLGEPVRRAASKLETFRTAAGGRLAKAEWPKLVVQQASVGA